MATYLMGMYSTYGMSNSPATYAAQSLYEKGLISYPRTDSTRISSKDFIAKSKKEITNLFGKELYAGLPVAKKGGQDAHEAIRPVNANVTPMVVEGLKINEKKAYTFI
jgi:DNA topoisomerase-1